MFKAPLVPIIIALNIAVYFMWSVYDAEFMNHNFAVSWNGVMEGYYWPLVTSVFSHNIFLHILLNMFVLRSFGSLIEQVLGSWRFLKFYLFAGVCGSLLHILLSKFLLNQPEVSAVGASGAIAGLVLVFSLLFPKEKILLLFVIPVPALLGAILLIGIDLWGLMAQAEGGGWPIGHGAHLGGAAAGILYYLSIRKFATRDA